MVGFHSENSGRCFQNTLIVQQGAGSLVGSYTDVFKDKGTDEEIDFISKRIEGIESDQASKDIKTLVQINLGTINWMTTVGSDSLAKESNMIRFVRGNFICVILKSSSSKVYLWTLFDEHITRIFSDVNSSIFEALTSGCMEVILCLKVFQIEGEIQNRIVAISRCGSVFRAYPTGSQNG